MNTDLLNTVKKITADYGESVLSDPKRLNGFLADMARDVPKPQKNALIKCLEHGFVQTLKDTPEPARVDCRQRLAQKLHEEEGLDAALCVETVYLLANVLFGEEKKKKFCNNCGNEVQEDWLVCPYCAAQILNRKNNCANCGKELQEGWKACPYCGTTAAGPPGGVLGSAISSGSGVSGYGVGIINPTGNTPPKKPPAAAAKPAQPAPYGDELFEKMRAIIAEKLEISERQVSMEASFRWDLGADSLDTYELLYEAEEVLGINIPDEKANEFETVRDAYEFIKRQVRQRDDNDW